MGSVPDALGSMLDRSRGLHEIEKIRVVGGCVTMSQQYEK